MLTDTVAAGAVFGRSRLKGDISGGITAGVLTIPVSMAMVSSPSSRWARGTSRTG